MTGLESIFLGYATGKIIDVSSVYLGDRVLTKPQKKKLTEIVEACLNKVFDEQAQGKNSDELRQLQDSLEYLLNQQHVLEHITPAVFATESPLDFETLGNIVEYNEGMVTSHQAIIVRQLKSYLEEALTTEARKNDSPLYNAVVISKIDSLSGGVAQLSYQLAAIKTDLEPTTKIVSETNADTSEILDIVRRLDSGSSAGSQGFEKIKTLLSDDVQSTLDELQHLYRTGMRKSALQALTNIQEGDRWAYLNNQAKAKILRRRAVWELNLGTPLLEVKEIATKAISLDAETDHTVLDAIIVYNEEGYQAAIDIISKPEHATSYNFFLALKLIHDSPSSVLDILRKNELSFDQDLAETKRLNALALLYTGSQKEALAKLSEITGRETEWRDIKLAKALALFWKNIGTDQIPEIIEHCPTPLGIPPQDIDVYRAVTN